MKTTVPVSFLPQFGIDVVTGYHGNQLHWYDNLLGGRATTYLSHPRFVNLVGAKYILLKTNVELPPNEYGDIPVQTAMNFKFFNIIQNDNALKRAYLVNKYEVFPNRQEVYTRVLDGEDDLSRVVYLEADPDINIPPDSIGTDSAWVISRTYNSVEVGIECTTNRLLVLNENYYDSWYAFGHPSNQKFPAPSSIPSAAG